ncbi:dihydrofolate reductase family protein [Sneathiella marina]|uniref:Dihydrofolate reductase family protein n=1 Tax=Sneathiella marina TaxID=2950108 RepID=A0ABY4W6X0_9PROT|nr:dihydrofolate reductase family protein [Sneathiella marina]USG62752.1 dihydrofolate reductase family protein [Sneathiella marina]
MRSLALLTFITLDGVMQAPAQAEEDRSGGFELGGWAMPYWPDVMAQVQEEAMSAPYDLLLGRNTYESFAAHNQGTDDTPVAVMLNKATKYVATTTQEDLSWQNSHILQGDVASAVADLKRQDGPLLQVHGSWQLIQTLLAQDLVDEFRLWTFPVLAGPGKRLFGPKMPPGDIELVKSGATSSGVVMTLYRRARR